MKRITFGAVLAGVMVTSASACFYYGSTQCAAATTGTYRRYCFDDLYWRNYRLSSAFVPLATSQANGYAGQTAGTFQCLVTREDELCTVGTWGPPYMNSDTGVAGTLPTVPPGSPPGEAGYNCHNWGS